MGSINNFALLVSEDIKNKADQRTRDYLRLEENRDLWRACLLDIIETVSGKIDMLDTEISALRSTYTDFSVDPAAALEDQKSKSMRFRFHAEKRLAELDRMSALGDATDPSVSLATFLRDCIIEHRRRVSDSREPCEADTALWASLDGEWKF
jgi:hypothetical protein